LAETAPNMPLVIEENYTSVLTERLKQGDLDAIVIALPFDEPGILTLPLYKEPFVLLLPSAHPLARRQQVDAQALAKENVLLLGAGHCFRDQVLEACPQCRARTAGDGGVIQNLEGSSLETIRYMVASGLGITVLPCSASGADRFSERLVQIRRFKGSAPARTVALAWRKSFPRPEAITALRNAVLACHMSCVEAVK
jgi:LysR family hydrogen peroxide-inducible transcriptional activator